MTFGGGFAQSLIKLSRGRVKSKAPKQER